MINLHTIVLFQMIIIIIIIINLIKRLNSSIQPTNGTLTGTTTLSQSEPENNGNEELLHIPQTPIFEPQHQMQCLTSYPEHGYIWEFTECSYRHTQV